MKLLLDTNVMLWFQRESNRLDSKMLGVICDSSNEKFFSMASLWEISIKYSLGKLSLEKDLKEWMDEVLGISDLYVLPITKTHLLKCASLPFVHRDLFDRLIFAQSLVEGMELLSSDGVFEKYRELLKKEARRGQP